MPTEIIFATNNANKVKEIKAVTGNLLTILSLEEAGILIDIPEPHDTLEANASEKSKVIHQLTGKNCFSEDTGLEVEALNGAPGVKSARYAGDTRNFQANIDLLLNNLEAHANKKAQFRTVISLIWNNQEYLFEGICKGQITHQAKGISGFGYDPVFIPLGTDNTFAEMSMEEKNLYSHRKKAMQALLDFFNQVGVL
ncbi:RdgB/HAM1 family non-canonical purine NTP pyrophosphatase [Sediminibacterium sp. C3]|uniref:RdgB/HAM1 family non-canonical purine NTP pyrophosphatase n=1 Tax=Sediminibacterium sp. C3 TaxID=1267211 RepID=UPI0004088C73|nr:RdgB/HAM1 family non-canonical purine NTP pyrophosphatase [Sediminibacterium sp. C3]